MALDFIKIHEWITAELTEFRSIGESMRNVIDQCSSDAPHRDWQRLRDLPFDDLDTLQEWIERALRFDPPSISLRGLWFGIFNPNYDGTATADCYISGSDFFDPNPDSNEWACRPKWWPKSRYANSEVMAAIYNIAYEDDGLGNDAEYPMCLAYGAFVVRALLNILDPQLILKTVSGVGVAVGFDSGDFLLLGEFTRDGLRRF